MFDYFKKHKLTLDEEKTDNRKPKKDKVFIVILILLIVFLVIGFVTGNGGTADSSDVENNFKFRFNISDGIMIGLLTISYIVMRIRGRRDR